METNIEKHHPKRIFALIVLIILTLFLLIPAQGGEASEELAVSSGEGLIRLHVRASDDSEEAQAKKLLARDAINAVLGPRLIECTNVKEARRVLLESVKEIEDAAQKASGQKAVARLTRETFPDRVYGDTLYPAGEYEALIVELDGGQGSNWWCIAFPPLCYSSVKTTKSDKQESKRVKIVYKSRVFEWLKKLFK